MSLGDIIANYIAQQRCLGKRFSAEATILAAFKSAVSDVQPRDITYLGHTDLQEHSAI
jgi:hypothetical protein